MKKFIYRTAVLLSFVFFISAYAGFHLADEFPHFKEILERFFSQFKGYIEDPPMLMALLLANNAGKTLVAMLGGFFFGILPVIFVAVNGFIVGIVISFTQPEIGSKGIILAILPHGVFEITGVIIACSYGVWLGVRFYYSLFKGEEFMPYLKEALFAYFRIVLPLLILAAFIEAFITPILVEGYINL